MVHVPFIKRLALRNFRSIRNEYVEFGNPMFLVGRNASGKSNFLDAFAFLSDCMRQPLKSVIEERGGINRTFYIFTEAASPRAEIRADFQIDKQRGHYSLSMEFSPEKPYRVSHEQCVVSNGKGKMFWFDRRGNAFTSSIVGVNPLMDPQALVMPIVGGVKEFAPVLRALADMRVYAIDPKSFRQVQDNDSSEFLNREGSNISSILLQMQHAGKQRYLNGLLDGVTPGVQTALRPEKLANGRLLLMLDQDLGGPMPVIWDASALSDGTLRALGVIVAAMQDPAPTLVAIEEPEATIHPGALDAIAEKIRLAAERSQVIVTTHSPELLDTKWIQPENIRVVEWKQGATRILPLGEVPVKALRQHHMGAGELLRSNALDAAERNGSETQAVLYDELPA